MEEFDIVIIGAGVVGLAVASELAQSTVNKSILVLEKADSFGRETSSRNSEVIHGGMYYPAGTLKADLCVKGRRLLYELCAKQKIPCKKIGKLIIAVEDKELADLEGIHRQGKLNSVEGLKMISGTELKKMEPNLNGISALLSEETGIIDSHRLMEYFLQSSKDKGVTVAYNCEVVGIDKINSSYKIMAKNMDETLEINSTVVINCAGLDSDIIAKLAGIDLKKNKYELHYCKGQYFRVATGKAKLLNHLAYPVPKPKSAGLGVHATLDLGGGLRLGPDDKYLHDRIKDYLFDESKKIEFYTSAVKFMPFIKEQDLSPDTSGIRPKLQEESGEYRDFVVKEESDKGLPGFVNLIGIESPGLTACPAIAEYVKGLLR
ncbi:MAG: FAD-dependent oxidoreductase [Candidatus Omnitrophica bacterium CG11_big_fil_rev_8_21_14_0_20_43_6]|nr:MAG: FAD-dependent oxidoreductase [Candidatus Omnitrophica bacterium CG11_big_fil_rev_8_21_14_0_20_43_6]